MNEWIETNLTCNEWMHWNKLNMQWMNALKHWMWNLLVKVCVTYDNEIINNKYAFL